MPAHFTAATFDALEHAAPRRGGGVAGLFRSGIRCIGFALVLAFAAADYARALCFRRAASSCWRAAWLQRWNRIVARLIGLQLEERGSPPKSGMIVSNHLSYLDIIAYSALLPCVFVAKKEVASWPILGLFARMAGTIFVERAKRMDVASVNLRIAEALGAGTLVVLFPEGTSSDGRAVLPFHSSLMDPATRYELPITPAAIRYFLDDGSVSEEVCYWRDMTFLPHLANFFSKRTAVARVAFGAHTDLSIPHSRKEIAQQLYREVADLRAALGQNLSRRALR